MCERRGLRGRRRQLSTIYHDRSTNTQSRAKFASRGLFFLLYGAVDGDRSN